MVVRIANREDSDQTASALVDFFARQLVFKILGHLPCLIRPSLKGILFAVTLIIIFSPKQPYLFFFFFFWGGGGGGGG